MTPAEVVSLAIVIALVGVIIGEGVRAHREAVKREQELEREQLKKAALSHEEKR